MIFAVAAEEMLHWAMVQNLLTAVGSAPYVSRPHMPHQARGPRGLGDRLLRPVPRGARGLPRDARGGSGLRARQPVAAAAVRGVEGIEPDVYISDPATGGCSELFNAVYGLILQMIARYFAFGHETPGQRQVLAHAAVGLMFRAIKPLGLLLAALPRSGRHTLPTSSRSCWWGRCGQITTSWQPLCSTPSGGTPAEPAPITHPHES